MNLAAKTAHYAEILKDDADYGRAQEKAICEWLTVNAKGDWEVSDQEYDMLFVDEMGYAGSTIKIYIWEDMDFDLFRHTFGHA